MRLPFGPAYAMEVAKLKPSVGEYIKEIDRLLLYVGRYGRQDALAMQTQLTMRDLIRWASLIDEFLEREKNSLNTER